MKKIIALMLILVGICAFTACSNKNTTSDKNAPSTTASDEQEFVKPKNYASVLLVTINPQFKLYLDENDTVLAVEPVNTDAKEIIDSITFENESVETVVDKVVTVANKEGFIKENATINLELVEAVDSNVDTSALLNKVTASVNQAVSDLELKVNVKAEDTSSIETESDTEEHVTEEVTKENITEEVTKENITEEATTEEVTTEEPTTEEPTTEEAVTEEITTGEIVTEEVTDVYDENTIPKGCKYIIAATGEVLNAGDRFPETPAKGDIYETKDYEYCYKLYWNIETFGYVGYIEQYEDFEHTWEWGVKAKEKKSSYEEILSTIAGKDVTTLSFTFSLCPDLAESPKIPKTVTAMPYTYTGCYAMIVTPEIPDGVKDMNGTFSTNFNLTTVTNIPNSVVTMKSTFSDCSTLKNIPDIPESVVDMEYTFSGCNAFEVAPKIPSGVKNLKGTFQSCENITEIKYIPEGVINMKRTFFGCNSLKTVSGIIPESVQDLEECFYECPNLTGTITINANITDTEKVTDLFLNTIEKENLQLSGTSPAVREQYYYLFLDYNV